MPPKLRQTAEQVRKVAEKRREDKGYGYEEPSQRKRFVPIAERRNRHLSPFPRDKPRDKKNVT